jgi:hypothetical protein
MFSSLMNATARNNIHIITNIILYIVLSQATTNFHKRPPRPTPILFLQGSRRLLHIPRSKVIKHNHIRTCIYRLLRFVEGLAFHFYFDGETSCGFCGGDGGGDVVVAGPDVVVFEHCHGGQVLTVGVAAADYHAVFFDQAETWGCFSGAGEGVFVAGFAEEGEEGVGSF